MRKPLILNTKGVDLVFGLDWQPLVGADPVRLARERVRRHGATHSVMSGASGAAVGLTWLERGRGRRRLLYSGAQVFALLHPRGAVATMLDLGVHGWCTLAAHEGVVLARSDKVYADRMLAETALEDIRQAYPSARVIDHLDRATGGASLESLAVAAPDAVHARLRLAPLAWWRRPFVWAASALGCVVLGPWLIGMASVAGSSVLESPDADLAWSHAQAAALHTHRLHGEAGTRAVLAGFYALPVSLAGWRLVQADCASRTAQWVCKAEYVRGAARADNQGLLRAARSDWRFEFPTIDRAWAHWSSNLTSSALDQHAVPGPADHDTYWISALQAIRGAFSSVHIESSRALMVQAPLGADQRALPRPSGLRRYGMRSVQFAGPLRAANLLIPLTAHIAWSRAVLSIVDSSSRGLAPSSINLTLDGVLYEMEDPEGPNT